MTTPIEAAVNEIVSLTNSLDAGIDLLIDHARKDRKDAGKHRAETFPIWGDDPERVYTGGGR